MTKMKMTRQMCGRLLMLATAASLACDANGKSLSLDLRRPAQNAARTKPRSAALPESGDAGMLRSFNLDAGAANVGEVATGDELTFTLFDDVAISLTLGEQMPSPLGGDAFIAEVIGYDGVRNAVVLRTEDGLTIDVQDYLNDRLYKVISTPAGVMVREIEPTKEGLCGCDALEAPGLSCTPAGIDKDGDIGFGQPTSSEVASASRAAAQQGDTCVDILVAYDRNAAAYANANGGGITNFAQVAVQKMNAALANTGLDASFRFRLVGVTALPVSTNDVHEALYAISDDKAGWTEIKTARETFGADIVTTLIDTGSAYGTTGVGWSLFSEASLSSFAPNAYNVCAVRSVAQSHTMTHECGHNMGAGHSSEQETQPGPQLYNYSAGYYFTGSDKTKYCTIMAYSGEGPGGTQIPYFSSPNYTFAGVAVGNATHDNTRTLAATWSYAANWRSQKVPMSYDITFEPTSGALIDGSLAVALTPGKAGTEIRYTLDGSTPTASSALYTDAVTLRGTTTIKAATVIGGTVSLPFSATYYAKDDIGYALGIPQLTWTLSVPATSLCGVQTTNAVDGVALGAVVTNGDTCAFSTVISGPATITWKRFERGNIRLRVLSDGEEVFGDSWGGYSLSWAEQSADIPAGEHAVEFQLGSGSGITYYWLDDFHIYYAQKPTFSPATTSTSSTATTFTDELMVSLASPDDGDAAIYYTLDGSSPDGEDAILYDGPFFVDASTCVKAIATVPGRGTSAIATGYYIKHVQPQAGEWTLWGEAAYEAVQNDGRLIADLCWNYPGCGWSAALEPVMTSPAFTTWAAANGVYLLAGSWGGKVGATGSRFSSLYRQTALYEELNHSTYFPTFVFAAPSDLTTCLGAMLARNDNTHTTNGRYYRGTPESLIECFASFLGATPLGAPVASVTDANGRTFPFSVTLSNTNGTGTIYYTLDGSAPTRERGIRYTGGAIAIPASGTTLKAVVWPDDANGVSGIPLAITYESLTDTIGMDGVTWTNDASHPWTVARTSSGVTLSGGKDLNLTSGSATSTLTATVNGPGAFHFRYYLYIWYTSLELQVNGLSVAKWSRDINAETNLVITAEGTTEFKWIYTYPSSEVRYGSSSRTEISDISWTPHVAPTAVAGLAASGGEYAFGTLIRWAPVANATSYAIYRGESNNSAAAEQIGTTKQLRFWDTTGVRGKTYRYWIKAVNAYGESAFSASVSGWRPILYSVAYNANGGTGSMRDQTFVKDQAQALSPNVFKRIGWKFAGWATSPSGPVIYADGELASPSSDMTLYAQWEECEFETGGNADWTQQPDGSWQSGAITHSQSTWIQMTVSGSGTLTFDWKVSSESGYDKLFFYIDGVSTANISGTKDWAAKTYEVTNAGTHTFKWTYSKDVSVSSGSDCGWIQDVVWMPDVVEPAIVGDFGAQVTGDAQTGFVIVPSSGIRDVVVSIPNGLSADKVTVEVSPDVERVTANGASVKVMRGGNDITGYLDIPAAVNGVIDLAGATVKPAIVREAMDVGKGAVIVLNAAEPSLTTPETRPGLTYTLFEGVTPESLAPGDSKVGDGTKWTPTITIKGGASGFYSIRVGK